MFLLAEAMHSDLTGILLDFKSNFINWVLLIIGVLYLAAKILPGLFAVRKTTIETTLDTARSARLESEALLAKQKERVANAEKEAEQILVEAHQVSERMKLEIQEETKRNLSELTKKFEAAIANERQIAVQQMRHVAVKAAISLIETQFSQEISTTIKTRLLQQFMEQLETLNGASGTPEKAPIRSGSVR